MHIKSLSFKLTKRIALNPEDSYSKDFAEASFGMEIETENEYKSKDIEDTWETVKQQVEEGLRGKNSEKWLDEKSEVEKEWKPFDK